MITETQSVSWAFGGWMGHLPSATAWRILGGAAVAGIGLVIWSYHWTLVTLSPFRRLALCALRGALWLALLIILAAPTRISRSYEQPAARPLAVLVDQSGSMTAADNRQHRRIDDALRRWREIQPVARMAYSDIKYFAFAGGMAPIPAAESVAAVSPQQTKFFDATQRVMASAPAGGWAGIVTLTDGLDTGGAAAAKETEPTVRTALAAGTPLFYVIGRNRYAGGSFFELRQFDAPTQTLPKSTFRVEATFDSFQAAARAVPLQFKVNGVERPVPPLRLEEGRRLATWSAEVQADEPGVVQLELKAGDEISRTVVRVAMPPSNRILYYQGALDWGYRFLADILKRDSSFALTPVFNFPNPAAILPAGAVRQMPLTEKELAPFEIVILANVAAGQLSNAQQTALGTWVHNGGILLFLTPDDDSTQSLSGSELEKLLPVVFAPPQAGPGEVTSDLGRAIASLRGSPHGPDPTKLVSYAWEQTPRVQEIFAEAEKKNVKFVSPLFSQYAHVAHAKPGADVLARHPTDLAPGGGEHAILLAVQRYGRGQSGVMTTDALWRWKLNEATTDRQVEFFWQTLFAWLGRDRAQGIHFEQAPLKAETGSEISLRVADAGADAPTVEAVLGKEHMALSEGPADGAVRVFRWRAPHDGFWEITATDVDGREAHHWISAQKVVDAGELSGRPPNEELLRELAARTGGDVLDTNLPPSWQAGRSSQGELLGERKQPLWHQTWILGALLGLYGLELLLRRKWKLV